MSALKELNSFDVIILLAVGFFLLKGLWRGLIHEFFSLAGLLAGFILATKFMSDLGTLIKELLDIAPVLAMVLAFLLIFFTITLLVQLLIHTFRKLSAFANLGWLDKLGGTAIGFLKGATVVSLLLLFISIVPQHEVLLPSVKKSKLYEPGRRFAPIMFNLLMDLAPGSKSFYTEFRESLRGKRLAKGTESLLKAFEAEEKAAKTPDKEKDDSY